MKPIRPPRIAVKLMIIMLIVHLLSGSMLFPVSAQTDRCKKFCQPPALDTAHVVIDANTGKILEGTTKFSENEKVQVVFKNKNPFKYQYRFDIVSTPLDTAIITEFVRQIPGLGSLNARGGFGGAPGAPLCDITAVDDANGEYEKTLNDISKLSTSIKELITPKVEILNNYNKFVSLIDSDFILCEKACADSEVLRPSLSSLTNLGNLPDRINDLKGHIATLRDKFNTLEAAVKAVPPGPDKLKCADKFKGVEDRFKNEIQRDVTADVDIYSKDLKSLQDNKGSFESLGKNIDSVLADPSPFYEVRYPQTTGGPTGVRITIFRKNRRDPSAKEVQVGDPIDLQVGESPLSLSAGIGFSSIPDRKIIRQSASVSDGMGGMKVGSVFGFENNSTFKPSGVVMINGSLRRFDLFGKKDSSIALSTGLVLSSRNNTTEAEFIAGPSLGIIESRIFLTFGFHAARVETLAGGFKINDQIPTTLNDPLPIERNWKKGFMFAITYKLK